MVITSRQSGRSLSIQYHLMKYLFKVATLAVIALAVIQVSASITNTTAFWNSEFVPPQKLAYQSYTGFEDVDWYFPKSSASIYYSLWQGYQLPWEDKTVPLIIWLQGGPGAPSQFGCFNLVGPIYIEGKTGSFRVSQNPWSWNIFGHILCIDQPVGVGFSYNNNTNKVNNTRDSTSHLVNFLYNFFANNPKLNLKDNPLYIAGESYAGHYIPALAERIKSNSSLGINLQGIMIGDGLVDGLNQFNNYDSYLSSVAVVSNEWRDTMSFMQNQAITRIMRGDLKQGTDYINFLIDDDDIANKYYGGLSIMNYRQYLAEGDNTNPDYKDYIQAKKKNFGVPDWLNYVPGNDQMYADFGEDISMSFKRELERVLNYGVKTLIYNGQNDVIINTPGVLAYLNTLEWSGAKDWKAAPKKIWNEFGTGNLGWNKRFRNLNFVLVRNAGHMVPADQPRSAWAMINKYFLGSW